MYEPDTSIRDRPNAFRYLELDVAGSEHGLIRFFGAMLYPTLDSPFGLCNAVLGLLDAFALSFPSPLLVPS
jgi:hypothetical protein